MSGNAYTLPDSELERLLAEDVSCGDATSFALGIGDRPGRLVFRARQAIVACASEEARRMGELHGLRCVGNVVASGTRLAAGEAILTLEGPAAALHTVWKTAQTFMDTFRASPVARPTSSPLPAPKIRTLASPARARTSPAPKRRRPRPSSPAAPVHTG